MRARRRMHSWLVVAGLGVLTVLMVLVEMGGR